MSDFPLLEFDCLDSTNLEARRMAEAGDFSECAIAARRQTGGRGRLGRSFFSPDGGLYLSLLLKPDLSPSDALSLTTAAAVAVCRAIEELTSHRACIKWVNDVYIGDRKVCGILTEAKISGGRLQYAIVGIGVNIIAPENGFPAEIADRAGALYDYNPSKMAMRIPLAQTIIRTFLGIIRTNEPHYEEYRRRSMLIGKKVNVHQIHDGESLPATVIGIDEACRLEVKYEDGRLEALTAGEVTLAL
ncbi:MAG: biotin--[acetyl-CoA-carboxylase] ligase [Ruminococcaceae bacterium]|nr:biotin--[acetyl-CoA-carboxylase] ligase [Oscillospiraceae bacterium]